MIRVLIAEDDPQCARQLRQFLDSYSQETGRTFRITHYDNGEDLVERYQPEFDLLLLDCELHAQRELDAMQNILQNQYVQYKQSRENIDVVNRKYHDLKHQIAVLRAEQDPQRRCDFLDGMEEEIRAYEAQNKTGNSVLDTVLTGKSLYCARHGIELTCVADGARLDFMDVMDICSIFGNVLDNAIECELTIPDRQRRLIHLAVYGKKDFLVIQCGNRCERELKFQDGLPLSTKGDGAYHGFGVRSIRWAAEKYGGTMTIHNRGGWFELNIVIPVKEPVV